MSWKSPQNLFSNTKMEVLRLSRGASRGLTFQGASKKFPNVSGQAHEEEFKNGRALMLDLREVGMQSPGDFHAEVPQKNSVWSTAATLGEVLKRLADQKESHGKEGHVHVRSNHVPHDDLDTSEIRGVAGDWLYQRQKCDLSSPIVRGTET